MPCLQCQALLESLQATQLCFSCAHGRPTTVPLVDLRLLRRALQLRAASLLSVGTHNGSSGFGGAADGALKAAGLAGLKARLESLVG